MQHKPNLGKGRHLAKEMNTIKRYKLFVIFLTALVIFFLSITIYQSYELQSILPSQASLKANVTSSFAYLAQSCSYEITSLNRNISNGFSSLNANQVRTDNNVSAYGQVEIEHWSVLTQTNASTPFNIIK